MRTIFGKIHFAKKNFTRAVIDGNSLLLDNGITAPENSTIFDYSNHLILPSLFDHHVHFFQTGIYDMALDASEMHTVRELLALITSKDTSKHMVGEILWIWGFDPIDNMPSSQQLDSICGNLPVLIRRADGHSCSLSSATKKMLSLDLPENGIVCGKTQELVVQYFLEKIPEQTIEQAAFDVCHKARLAGASKLGAFIPRADWVANLQKFRNKLPCDVEIFFESEDVALAKKLGADYAGGCLLLDGSFGSRTAALSSPYTDDPNNYGVLYFSSERLEKFFSDCTVHNMPAAMHAIGDRAIEQFISGVEKNVHHNAGNAKNWRIEHAELISHEQLTRCKALDLTLSVQPVFETRWGGKDKLYQTRLGNRFLHTNPFALADNLNIKLVGGSDSYVTPISPLAGIFSAMHHPNESFSLNFDSALSLFAPNVDEFCSWTNKFFIVLDGSFEGENVPTIRETIFI